MRVVSKRALLVGGAALLAAAVFTAVVCQQKPAVLWDWLITFVATLLSVIAAVALFWYQRDKSDSERQDQLLTALSVELWVVLKILDGSRYPVGSTTGEELGTTVMETLPTTVLEETVRSGLYSPEWTSFLVHLVGYIQAHNNDVWYFRSTQVLPKGPAVNEIVRTRVEYMEWRLGVIEENCRNLVEDLKKQGMPQPQNPIHSENSSTTE